MHSNEPQRRRNQSIRHASCPTCGVVFEIELTKAMPFCSSRCQQIDLGRWFDEAYGLPVEPEAPNDEDFYDSDIYLN